MVEPNDLQRGWIELPGLLSPAECTEVVTACETLCVDASQGVGRHPRDKPASGTRHLEDLHLRVPLVAEALTRSALTDAVAAWFGEPSPPPVQVSWRCPGPGFGEQDLHRDAIEGPPPATPLGVTAIVALIDFQERNGATRVVPGTHRTTEPAANYRGRKRAPSEQALTGTAGTAFVFTAHLLHAGGANESTNDRPALQIIWRR